MIFKEGEVESILVRLQIVPDTFRGDEILALCPGHESRTGRPDRNPSWSINVESGVHHCFSCGFKGSMLFLVVEILDLRTTWGTPDYEAAKSWIRRNFTVDLDALSKQLSEMKDAYVSIPKPVPMSEARLALFEPPPDWALDNRGLTAEAAAQYGVLWDPKTDHWITPIRDEDGKLMGWQEKGETDRFFRNRPAGIAKSKSLFGLDAWTEPLMVVVESPLDAVRFKSVGIDGAVASYGAIVSDDQLSLMRRADKLIFALDNPRVDQAGEKALLDLLVRVRKLGLHPYQFNYQRTKAKDPGDMSATELHYGVENARHFALGRHMLLALG